MPQKGKIGLKDLPHVSQMMGQWVTVLRQMEHLFSPMKQSPRLRDHIPAVTQSKQLDVCLHTHHLVQLYQSQCDRWLKTSLTAEQKEAIAAVQNALSEVKTLQAALVAIITRNVSPSFADTLPLADMKRVLHESQNPLLFDNCEFLRG